jgi:hypothetical protein
MDGKRWQQNQISRLTWLPDQITSPLPEIAPKTIPTQVRTAPEHLAEHSERDNMFGRVSLQNGAVNSPAQMFRQLADVLSWFELVDFFTYLEAQQPSSQFNDNQTHLAGAE